MNRCGYCDRKIEDEQALFARGRLWHVNHLLCDECGCRIQEEEKFEEKEGIIVCRHCYLNGKNPKCAGKS
ncbi:LIM domain protein, partial [Teladorsagia circumcincta]